ncbi:FtsH protease activity modulator HflK [Sneathiella sp.]|uniref:FtsH protease activity modulator HflK n=1 Tax=Sneathiella sp. TaxID=1964365 RepID=UPI00356855B2
MATYDPEDVVIELRKRAAKLGSKTISLAIAGLLLLYFVATSWFTVQPAETGIIQRFGAVHRTVGPGLHFKFPRGIEKVRMLPTARVLKEEFGFATSSTENTRTEYAGDKIPFKEVSLMLSGDLNVIDLQWIVQYRIEDPTSYLFQVRESRKAIRDTSEAVMRRVVGNRLGSEVLTVGRVGIATEVKAEMQKILSDYGTGVRLVTVELQDVTPPDPVKPAFNEVNEARQDRERTINQAQEQANREIPKARGEAVQTVTQAEGYAVERVNRAEGEATRFKAILADYKKSPEVTRSRLYLEAMASILPKAKALYIVDSDQQAMLPMLSMDGAQQPISGSQASKPPAGVNGGIQK